MLQTIPWDKVNIEVILVESVHAGKVFPGSRKEIHTFLEGKNYEYVGSVGKLDFCIQTLINWSWSSPGIDDVFIHKKLSQGIYKVERQEAEEFLNYQWLDPDEEWEPIFKDRDEL